MVHFPFAAQPLMVLCCRSRLMWQEASGVESMMDMPEHLPCTCLEKQQQVQCDLCLPLDEAVVGNPMWEVSTHMLADIAQIEGL